MTTRVPTRTNRDDRYFTDTYQVMPRHGYTRLFESMLSHPIISVMLQTDFQDVADLLPWKHLIYTGSIDAFFNHKHGQLPYRSLSFEHVHHSVAQWQAVGTINHPNDCAYTRVTEFKHLTGQQHAGTSLVYEHACSDGDPYYPVPTAASAALFERYREEADALPDVTLVGRLASYRYYNMDQVVGQALAAFKRLCAETSLPSGVLPVQPLGQLIA